jgi:hypothetical protein
MFGGATPQRAGHGGLIRKGSIEKEYKINPEERQGKTFPQRYSDQGTPRFPY